MKSVPYKSRECHKDDDDKDSGSDTIQQGRSRVHENLMK